MQPAQVSLICFVHLSGLETLKNCRHSDIRPLAKKACLFVDQRINVAFARITDNCMDACHAVSIQTKKFVPGRPQKFSTSQKSVTHGMTQLEPGPVKQTIYSSKWFTTTLEDDVTSAGLYWGRCDKIKSCRLSRSKTPGPQSSGLCGKV